MNQTKMLLVIVTGLCCFRSGNAGTILKLGFSNDSLTDVRLLNDQLSTVDDGDVSSAGDQNTEVTYRDVLAGQAPIVGPNASVTIEGISIAGVATLIDDVFIVQPTSGGSFSLYDDNDALLLEGSLGDGRITGPIGGASTGSFLTTGFGSFTGGILKDLLSGVEEASWSISLSNVKSGSKNGFSISTVVNADDPIVLLDFEADATANIAIPDAVPEPAGFIVTLVSVISLLFWRRKN